MPFTRRTRRRRTRRRRPTALRAVRRLARFVDTELHQSIQINENIAIQGSGTFFQLVSVAQGDDDINRDGIQIGLRRLEMKLHVDRGANDSCFRLILFVDKQTNGAVPLLSQVLQITATDVQTLVSPINNDGKRRFTILSDRTRTVIDGNSNLRCFNLNRKLTNRVRFTGIGAGVPDVSSGMLWLLAVSDQTGIGNSPDLSLISRVWFAP